MPRRATRKTSRLSLGPFLVEGFVKRPQTYALPDLFQGFTIEDRVYRLRCVEGWSMVIPWQGFQLSDVVKRLEPAPQAKYNRISDLVRSAATSRTEACCSSNGLMSKPPNGRGDESTRNSRGWVVRKAAFAESEWRSDSARDAVEIRIQRIKSIAKIRFVEKQPVTAWMRANA